MHKVYKNLNGVLRGTKEAQMLSSLKRLALVKKKIRKEGKQLEEEAAMRKKLILKPAILDFDFGDEGEVPLLRLNPSKRARLNR